MVAAPAGAESAAAQAWSAFAGRAAAALAEYEVNTARPRIIQEALLSDMLRCNADTQFGREFGFASIRSADEFRARVPVSFWETVAPWVERAKSTHASVLTAEAPMFFERTSGSSAAAKDIPYTQALLSEFQRALVVWLAKLYEACPDVAGPGYWALSPPGAAAPAAPNGIPVGCVSDADYLEGCAAEVLLATAVDTSRSLGNVETWRLETLGRLLETGDLRMLSVWSPTFLSALLAPLLDESRRSECLDWLRQRQSRQRVDALTHALEAGHFDELWPDLQIISCWMDGQSRHYAAQLAELFPHARLQAKGLFATEGVVSLPWGMEGRCPLAIESHFLEFLDEHDEVFLADEICLGQRYRPLLTTSGGLYRYCLGDVVEVTDFLNDTPCIRFCGRSDARTDLVGEKLDDSLVAEVCATVLPVGARVLCVPVRDAAPPYYALIVEEPVGCAAGALIGEVEERLCRVIHYGRARELGQLAPLRVLAVPSAGRLLHQAWEALGRRAGDVKPVCLVTLPELAREVLRLAKNVGVDDAG